MSNLLYRCPYDRACQCGMDDSCGECVQFKAAVLRGDVEIFDQDGQKIVRGEDTPIDMVDFAGGVLGIKE